MVAHEMSRLSKIPADGVLVGVLVGDEGTLGPGSKGLLLGESFTE